MPDKDEPMEMRIFNPTKSEASGAELKLLQIEQEIVNRIRLLQTMATESGSKRAALKFNVRANELSDLLGWIRRKGQI